MSTPLRNIDDLMRYPIFLSKSNRLKEKRSDIMNLGIVVQISIDTMFTK
jgi:hypothetical protein